MKENTMGSYHTAKKAICHKHSLPLFIALTIAGLAGNHFKFTIFLNIDFIFGSIFGMLALQFFGPGRGIPASALIAGYTYLLWNHPYAIIIMTAEAAVVSWLTERRRVGLVVADTLYWLVIGMPLVYLFYHVVMDVPSSNTYIVMLKQAMNGIANALIARLIFTWYALRYNTSLISYRDIVYNLLVFFVLFPTFTLLAVSSRDNFTETDQRIRSSLTQESLDINQNLETWAVNRKNAIAALAEMSATRSPQQMQPHLEQAKKSDMNFLRIGLVDKNATTTAYFPLIDELGQKNIGKNFSDRPYIPELTSSLKPMLSEVVMGRIGNPRPFVSMLAPVVIHGKYSGYVIGVLGLEQVREQLDKISAKNASLYTLLDKNGNVIMTNRSDQTVMSSFSREKGNLKNLENGVKQWVPIAAANTPISERWKKSYYVLESQIGTQTEWKLILEQPVAPFQKMLHEDYTGKLTLLFLILISSLALAEFLSRKSMTTLENLRKTTCDLPDRLASGESINWPDSSILETRTLIENFQEMSDNIQRYVIELDLLNKSLHQRIEERTSQLANTMNELSIVLENAPIGISRIIDRKQVWVNSKTEQMLQYSKEEMNFQSTRRLYPSDEAYEKLGQEAYPILEQGLVYETVQELVRKDGTHIQVRYIGKALEPNNLAKGTLWLLEDITDKKENEKLAKELRAEKLRSAAFEEKQRHLREKEMLVKDLHDGIGGIISNISLLAQYGNLSKSEHECRTAMQQIADLAVEGTTEVRSFMNSMEEGEATWNNLLAEIRVHCGNMLAPHGTGFNFNTSISEDAPPPGILRYVNIIRIFRELIANIVKHSGASAVTVTFNAEDNIFFLEVKDNGIGFDSKTVKRRGLGNIASRSLAINASFRIFSDNGTCARLEFWSTDSHEEEF